MSSDYLARVEWLSSPQPVAYAQALEQMEARVQAVIDQQAAPLIWFLEHPPLYTAGTSAKQSDLLDKSRLPVYVTGRGGEYTYHGPGQLVAYVVMDLKQLFAPQPPDLRAYIARLEQWIISALADYGIEGMIRPGRVGVWTHGSGSGALVQEAKIAAIGVRVRRWVAYHGLCINVHPNLEDYQGIVPCGIAEFGVTSLQKLGVDTTVTEMAERLRQQVGLLAP